MGNCSEPPKLPKKATSQKPTANVSHKPKKEKKEKKSKQHGWGGMEAALNGDLNDIKQMVAGCIFWRDH